MSSSNTFKILVITATLVAFSILTEAEDHNNRYNNVNIDEVLSNKRLLSAYVKCVLERGRCTPEGRELKNHITDALQNGCENCSEPQKDGVRKVIRHLVKKEQESWKELVEKYDPEGVYSQKYEDELNSI